MPAGSSTGVPSCGQSSWLGCARRAGGPDRRGIWDLGEFNRSLRLFGLAGGVGGRSARRMTVQG